jgi:mycothiol S-conjugate amidase
MTDTTARPSAPRLPDLAPFGIESHWRNRARTPRTLLVAFPHPDDESFGNAGTLARYSAEGVGVHYACVTRGECGTVNPKFLEDYPDISALRTAEMTCAAEALGLRAVHYMGYRDSGMPDTPDNANPAAFVQAPREEAVGKVVALIRALRPQVVLTFGPYGGYGHPDHIRIHEVTVAAFHRAADPAAYPEQIAAGLAPYQPLKLYYPTFGTRFLKIAVVVMRLLGRDPRHFGENGDVDMVRAAEEATPPTTVIACGAYREQILRAWRCHASQGAGMAWVERFPDRLQRFFIGRQEFTRVIPPPRRPGVHEHDLFAGVRPRPR